MGAKAGWREMDANAHASLTRFFARAGDGDGEWSQAYGLYQDRTLVLFPFRPGHEQRLTVIGRATRHSSTWSISGEIGRQTGELGSQSIEAWAFAFEAGHDLPGPSRGRVSMRIDGASGDNANTPQSEAWYSVFPAMAFLGRTGSYGPINAIGLYPEFAFNPIPALRVIVTPEVIFRASSTDAFTTPVGSVLISAHRPGNSLVLAGGGIQANWTPTPQYEVRTNLYHLEPQGAFIDAGGRSQTGLSMSLIGHW